jgi:hypothetical protein
MGFDPKRDFKTCVIAIKYSTCFHEQDEHVDDAIYNEYIGMEKNGTNKSHDPIHHSNGKSKMASLPYNVHILVTSNTKLKKSLQYKKVYDIDDESIPKEGREEDLT